MRIVLSFETERLKAYEKRGAPLVFGIAVEHQGVYYPSSDWLDFGVVILGWWVTTTLEMLQTGGEGTLYFMDGPYHLKARYRRPHGTLELVPEGRDSMWTVPFVDFIAELICAAKAIRDELNQRGVGADDQGVLMEYAALLERAMSSVGE